MRCGRPQAIAFVVVLALGMAGCGESGSGSPTEPSTTLTQSTFPSDTQSPGTTAPASALDPDDLLDELRESYGAPGAMAFLRASGTEWFGRSGSADLAGTELTTTTRFRIASITKTVVAFLVLDAVSRDEVSLDDEVSQYVPDVLREQPPITVRMLLDHTSGIFNVGDEGDIAADVENLTDPALQAQARDIGARYLGGEHVSLPAELFVALAETHDRYFEPGGGYHYSNVNYQLAAMVLERVTGETLGELVRTRLVGPLGLQHTSIAPDDAGIPEMHGYGLDAADGSLVDLTADFLALGNGGGGGVISTPEELLMIMQAIVGGQLLPQSLTDEMQHATSQSYGSYGLGLGRYELSCGTFYGHGGSVSGTQSIALADDDRPAGVVVVVNLRSDADPNLLALAESLLCAGA
ncbi:MAG: serine hydrolase domain-containing protein [Actinomycetota bacterium]|nr:serine hydrolase domain-containing protein [Actinomycetota bacterium]